MSTEQVLSLFSQALGTILQALSDVLGPLIPILILCTAALVLLYLLRKVFKYELKKPALLGDEVQPEFSGEFQRQKSLITKTENAFYAILKQAVGPKCDISCQVRIADMVLFPRGIHWQERQRLLNRLGSRHIDFVLCNPETMEILAAIELDDPSHDTKKRAKDDKLKNDVMSSAGIPLLRYRAQPHYDPERILTHLRHDAGLWQL